MAVFRHGDDFVACGTRTQQAEFKSELGQYFIVKQLAILGPCPALGDVQEVRILNRLVRWVKPLFGRGAVRLEYEAHPRHAELLVHQKPSVDFGTPLGRDEHTLYRQATVRRPLMAVKPMTAQDWNLTMELEAPEKAKQLTDNMKNIDKAIRMIKELVDKLAEQVNDEATQKDWCLTELSKNEQSQKKRTLKDDVIERNIIEMNELKVSLENLVEEEKNNVVQFNDENEDETSLKCNMQVFNERKLNVKDFNVEERVQCNDHRELLVVGVLLRKDDVRCTILTVGDFGGLKCAARHLSRNIEYDHTTKY